MTKGLTRSQGVGGASVLPGWLYRRAITADNSAGADRTNYAVKVTLSGANFDFSKADTNGADVRIVYNSQLVPYWIESWDSAGSSAIVWFKMAAVAAGATVTAYLYYGKAAAVSAASITATFIFGEDFTDPTRWRGYPDETYSARNGAVGIVVGDINSSIVQSSAGTWKNSVREQSNVILDAADADAAKRYKWYVTGNTAGVVRTIGVLFSPDGRTWTEYGSNPVISEGEDPYIVRNIDGSLYRDGSNRMHMFTEDQGQLDMLHYTSTDGIAWTADPANPVIQRGVTYDANIVASPLCIHTGSDNFTMLYESRSTTNVDSTSIARASGSLMGRVWTKEATNPVAAWDVIDDAVFNGTEWWLTHHQTAGNPNRSKSTIANPASWDSSSFTDVGPNPVFPLVPSSGFTLAQASDTPFGQALTTQPSSPYDRFDMFDVMGGTEWTFERLQNLTTPLDPYTSGIDIASGNMVLTPSNTSQTYTILAGTKNLTLTSNFEVMFRQKAEVLVDDQCAQFGFGSGTWVAASTAEMLSHYPDGYMFLILDPGAANSLSIRRYVADSFTQLAAGNSISATEAHAFNVYRVSYLSTGVLSYKFNGVEKITATDSNHLAVAKNITFAQGNQGATRRGSKLTVDWVAVRPFDGTDPATTVGSELAA